MSLSIWATPYVKAHPNRAPGMRLSVTSWTGCPFCGPVSPFPSHPAVCSVGPCKMWPLWQEWKLCTGSTTWTSPPYDSVTPAAVPTVTAGTWPAGQQRPEVASFPRGPVSHQSLTALNSFLYGKTIFGIVLQPARLLKTQTLYKGRFKLSCQERTPHNWGVNLRQMEHGLDNGRSSVTVIIQLLYHYHSIIFVTSY